MSEEIRIGPNPCAYCAGVYGDHFDFCDRPPAPVRYALPPALLEALKRYIDRGNPFTVAETVDKRALWKEVEEANLYQTVNKEQELITVCDNCLCASCWQGEFYCDRYKEAGTVQKTREELQRLGPRESYYYWKTDKELAEA